MKLRKPSPLLTLLLAACGGSEMAGPATSLTLADLAGSPFPAGTGPLDRAGAERRALDLVGGTLLDSESELERGLEVWEVEVRRASGAIVEVDVVASSGDILEIECERHVAGDDLRVEAGYISLAQAIRIATTARAGEVTEWELELDDGRAWTWELELRDNVGEFEVEVDAVTGAIELDHDGYDDWDDDDDDDGRTPPARLIATSTTIVQVATGAITIVEFEIEDGHWEVEVRTPAGAKIVLELTMDGRVIEAKGDDGPVDYDLVPPGLLSLSQALTAAGRTTRELEDWDLKREDGGFRYKMDFDDNEVEVDAVTGRVR